MEKLITDLKGGLSSSQNVIDQNHKAILETQEMYKLFQEFEEMEKKKVRTHSSVFDPFEIKTVCS